MTEAELAELDAQLDLIDALAKDVAAGSVDSEDAITRLIEDHGYTRQGAEWCVDSWRERTP
jgi:hypothetical protein